MSAAEQDPGVGGKREIRGGHVLAMMIGFFAVVFLVNGIFMYFAISTHTGVQRHNSYQSGLNYNERIRASEEQSRLGWLTSINVLREKHWLSLSFKTRSGLPVPGLKVTVRLSRPVTSEFDDLHDLVESKAGVYETTTSALGPGGWIVNVVAKRATGKGDKIVYRYRERLWLEPKPGETGVSGAAPKTNKSKGK